MSFDETAMALGMRPAPLYPLATAAKVMDMDERALRAEVAASRIRSKNVGQRERGKLACMMRGEWVDEWIDRTEGRDEADD